MEQLHLEQINNIVQGAVSNKFNDQQRKALAQAVRNYLSNFLVQSDYTVDCIDSDSMTQLYVYYRTSIVDFQVFIWKFVETGVNFEHLKGTFE